MEYMKNGSLDKFLTVGDGAKLNFNQSIAIAEDISNGMMYLEGLKVAHGDLAARNILIGDFKHGLDKYVVKIADFELAHFLNEQNEKPISAKASKSI